MHLVTTSHMTEIAEE